MTHPLVLDLAACEIALAESGGAIEIQHRDTNYVLEFGGWFSNVEVTAMHVMTALGDLPRGGSGAGYPRGEPTGHA